MGRVSGWPLLWAASSCSNNARLLGELVAGGLVEMYT